MPKPTVYIETSVVSYLVGRPSRNFLITARQRITRHWWVNGLPSCNPCVSVAVEDELGDGDPTMAAQRLAAIASFPFLAMDARIDALIAALLSRSLVPAKSPTDAAHLAIASVHGADFLVTWNFRHLANPKILPRVRDLCESLGYRLPEVCTPEQLLVTR